MDVQNVTTKTCSRCHTEKPFYEFHKLKDSKDGYRGVCKLCRSQSEGHKYVKPAPSGYQWCRKCDTLYPATQEHFYWNAVRNQLYSSCKMCHTKRTRVWHDNNREFCNELNRNWFITHPGERSKSQQKWKINHPESFAISKARGKITAKIWKQNNPERAKALAKAGKSRRRAREAAAPGTHTAADILIQIASQTDKKGHLRCWWCGCTIDGAYHVDHRVALAKGGTNWPDNLVISCPACNCSKQAKTPQEWIGRLL